MTNVTLIEFLKEALEKFEACTEDREKLES